MSIVLNEDSVLALVNVITTRLYQGLSSKATNSQPESKLQLSHSPSYIQIFLKGISSNNVFLSVIHAVSVKSTGLCAPKITNDQQHSIKLCPSLSCLSIQFIL